MMIECMIIERPFMIGQNKCQTGELYLSSPYMRKELFDQFEAIALKHGTKNDINEFAKFMLFDNLFKKATKEADFTDLVIVRYGGIGDIIALSSIIDYFEDKTIHFITQPNMMPVFDWFVNKPKLYPIYKPFLKSIKQINNNWAKFQCEGLIEFGAKKNWFEIFFDAIGENEPDIEFLRPQLKTHRINTVNSNIWNYQLNDKQSGISIKLIKKSLLICNKASSMMRTIPIIDIVQSLPKRVLNEYDIFVYEDNFNLRSTFDIDRKIDLKIITKIDLKAFLLDLYDADMVISVDSGALHFREGINKPAIGLYNSFTTDSRTKHYQYTKSFDIKSDCELQPCFHHATKEIKHCPKGNKEMFAAPCFDSKYNLTLHEQLSKIFNENL